MRAPAAAVRNDNAREPGIVSLQGGRAGVSVRFRSFTTDAISATSAAMPPIATIQGSQTEL
jgi:hypothetical protein